MIQFGEFDLLVALAKRGVDMAFAEVATDGRWGGRRLVLR
jgi:hypothetical protein